MSVLYSTVYITNNGSPVENLSPSWVIYRDTVSNTDVIPQASIDEIGNGLYRIVHNVDFGDRVSGLIDAGNTINSDSERFIPVAVDYTEQSSVTEVFVASVLDEPNQAILFTSFIQNNGVIETTTPQSLEINFYDFNHNLLFTVNTSTQLNGVFIVSQSTAALTLLANRPYYIIATITLTSGDTFTSGEVATTLQ